MKKQLINVSYLALILLVVFFGYYLFNRSSKSVHVTVFGLVKEVGINSLSIYGNMSGSTTDKTPKMISIDYGDNTEFYKRTVDIRSNGVASTSSYEKVTGNKLKEDFTAGFVMVQIDAVSGVKNSAVRVNYTAPKQDK